ncbi:alpha/beta hydrolase [Liquorilactobacillus oeni]|uniref:Esterase n=1 Tax=Liquorilactobacillus oeni DSM 19972 TaxID=1423777 RepID=A0A0R1MM59_9LACO|nr:alpha/beta hydrolase [Liquorilactobacillus oeni]KRL05675.1 esterase [Liquorilactobacillus oeni DSM 19972]
MSIKEFKIPLNNNTAVTVTAYLRPKLFEGQLFPGLIICAGGSFKHLSQRENTVAALAYYARGYNVFSLHYSLIGDFTPLYPQPIYELAATLGFLRKNAVKINQNPQALAVLGFSAGGHIVSALAGTWATVRLAEETQLANKMIRPNAQLLAYPVTDLTGGWPKELAEINKISETPELINTQKLVNKTTPPTFIWNSQTDEAVPLSNTLNYVQALVKNKISFEVHTFSSGIHGTVLANELTARPQKGAADIDHHTASWFELSLQWLSQVLPADDDKKQQVDN